MKPDPDSSRSRRRAHRRGQWSEYIAALWLMTKGYRIVAIRHRTPLGEIDLIALKKDLAVMVEVKARRQLDDAVFAVTNTAQNRIRSAADLWLAGQPAERRLSIRFDIVAIMPWRLPVHLVDAF